MVAMARMTNRLRIQQIAEWLRERFPTPLPVDVIFRKFKGPWHEISEAETRRVGRRIEIALDPRSTIYYLIHALIHEWAHAVDWRHGRIEQLQDRGEAPLHGETWGVTYAQIYRAFFDEKGWRESKDFMIRSAARRGRNS